MRLNLMIPILLVSLILFSCKKTDYAGEINRLETALASDATPENSSALLTAYKAFIDNNADDPATGTYLGKAADLAAKAGNSDEAVSLLTKGIQKYFDPEKSKGQVLALASVLCEKKSPKEAASQLLATFADPTQFKSMGATLMEECRTKSFDAGSQKLDKVEASNYVNITEVMAHAFPEDAAAPDQLFKAAEIASIVKKYDRSLNMYDMILEKYPNYEKTTQTLFLKGFTLDTHQKKFEEAKVIYESFLQKYPEDKFANSAKFLLENLGKPDDEIIKGFETKKK